MKRGVWGILIVLIVIVVLSVFVVFPKTGFITKTIDEPSSKNLSVNNNISYDEISTRTNENISYPSSGNYTLIAEYSREEIISNETVLENITEEISNKEDNQNITQFKISKENIPLKIVKSSDNFIASFTDKNNLDTNLKLIKGFVVNDSSGLNVKYILKYNFEVKSVRENQKTIISQYIIKIFLDKDGNIIDGDKSKEKYSYLKKEKYQDDIY